MQQRKCWTGLVVILILAMGYLAFQSKASSGPEDEVSGSQAPLASRQPAPISVQPQKNSITTPPAMTRHPDPEPLDGEGITVIGDSVIVGVEPYLKDKLPKIKVDGKVGRQMSHAKELIDELRSQRILGDRIIIELGTNGPFNKDHLRNLLDALSGAKQVLVVTTRVPKGWQDSVNATIKEVTVEFDNAKVVDWYTASEGKAEYFYKDGVHLKPEGSKYYASLLTDALKETE
jgi:lysophospholipase L1-like esterase